MFSDLESMMCMDKGKKKGNMRKSRTVAVGILLCCLSAILFCGTGTAEHTPWDCPDCGRAGITRNYCGKCSHLAPWMK